MTTADLLITNGTILTMKENDAVIANGIVVVNGSKIEAVGSKDLLEKYQAQKVIDAGGHIVMPGMINCHTHLPMTLFRGIGNDSDNVLYGLMFPLEKKFVDERFCYVGAQLGCIELIRSGVTCFADMYYFESAIAQAVDEIGMRAILGETIINFPSPDAPKAYGGFAHTMKLLEKYETHERIVPAFAPHAPYTVPKTLFKHVQHVAGFWRNARILTHLAETKGNNDTVKQLGEWGVLSDQMTAAHCIHVSVEDCAFLQFYQVGVSLCMEGNARGGSETGPAQDMLKWKIRAGLGSDGAMSSNTQDIFSQMRFASALQKHDLRKPTALPAKDVVKLATIGGARALHMEDRIGTLEAGKLADIVIVRNDGDHQFPSYDPYQTLVHATFPSDVRTTIVHGKVLMKKGQLLTVDPKKVRQAAEPIIARIQEHLLEEKQTISV